MRPARERRRPTGATPRGASEGGGGSEGGGIEVAALVPGVEDVERPLGIESTLQDVRVLVSGGKTLRHCPRRPRGHRRNGRIAWPNGRVGGFGRSYFGFSQWLMATMNPSHLTCFAPYDALFDPYRRHPDRIGTDTFHHDAARPSRRVPPDVARSKGAKR